jgi:hypothetical protein
LIEGVESCEKLGMVVWIYDEKGYPSAAAGGLVLRKNPEFEAQALAFDASKPDPFVVRPSYEYTHASNNYAASQRYPNLLDDRADASFIHHTHDAYWQRLEKHFGKTIQAFFTDEPSFMAVNIGPLPEEVRKKVRVADPVDPNYVPLPSVPWVYDLPERYQERYHQDLMAQRRSLFEGDTDADRQVRRQFWALLADLGAERYYGQIQTWCDQHHVASSGHTLWEEGLMHHVPLDGNKLETLGRMDIPGLDLLTSDPEAVIHSGWMTAGMPLSAALLHGRRRLMTEVSDFSQRMSKQGNAPIDAMRATAAWQAAWGVTEFTLYYTPEGREPGDYPAYGEFVGRLNTVLKPAMPKPEVLLYYPIFDLWGEYKPVAERLEGKSQTPLLQKITASFSKLGQTLQRSQNPFIMIDHEALASAKVEVLVPPRPQKGEGELQASPRPQAGEGPGVRAACPALCIADHQYTTIVLPEGVQLPESAAKVVEQFRQAGGRVLTHVDAAGKPYTPATMADAIQPVYRLSPGCEKITLGRFERDGRTILLLVNVGKEPYNGELSVGAKGTWSCMNPASGTVEPLAADAQGRVPLSLAGRQTLMLVSP